MPAWSPTEIEFLVKRLGQSTIDIFTSFTEEFGETRSYGSVQKKVKKVRDAYDDFDAETNEEEEIPLPSFTTDDEGDFFIPMSSAELIKRKKINREDARDWILSLAGIEGEWPQHRSVHPNPEKSSVVLVFSDTHFGKQTEWYNMDIGRKRFLSVPDKLEEHTLPDFDEIVVALLGDMVEGEDIYPTQNHHLEVPAFTQMKEATDAIWHMILKLKGRFPHTKIRIICTKGNHGRVSKTANENSNWDNVLYYALSLIVAAAANPDITMELNYDDFYVFQVKDKRGLVNHKGVKHVGTPAMQVKIAGWAKSKDFDFLLHGHWHEWHVGNWIGKFVMGNGCMCGPDDLAERIAKEDTARQGFFFVTPGKQPWGWSFFEWKDDETE